LVDPLPFDNWNECITRTNSWTYGKTFDFVFGGDVYREVVIVGFI
jgi:hypothetical protein